MSNRDSKRDNKVTSDSIITSIRELYYITLRKQGLSHKEVLHYIDKKELPDDYSNLTDYCY